MSKPKRIAVTGGRDYAERDVVWRALTQVWSLNRGMKLVHGAARGADALAAEWAKHYNRSVEAHPADWDAHGREAGSLRNQRMVDLGLFQLVAFPGGRGTADMVRRCREARVPILEAETMFRPRAQLQHLFEVSRPEQRDDGWHDEVRGRVVKHYGPFLDEGTAMLDQHHRFVRFRDRATVRGGDAQRLTACRWVVTLPRDIDAGGLPFTSQHIAKHTQR